MKLHSDEWDMIQAAHKFLEANLPWSDFHTSVKKQYAEKGSISIRQAQALVRMENKLIMKGQYKRTTKLNGEFKELAKLIARAGEHLKYPRIVFQVEGVDFHMYPAGERSRYPGWIQVKAKAANLWVGRINPETGELHRSRNMTPAVFLAIQEFSKDPIAAAKRYAQLTGNCCFCARDLTDPRSMTQGYGPICAGRYGLPWGEVNYA